MSILTDSRSPSSGAEVINAAALNIVERPRAEQLGNTERLSWCQTIEHFPAARNEWFNAWRIFFQKSVGLASWHDLSPGTKQNVATEKRYTLEMLRLSNQPEITLQNMAAVIYAAACQGDVKFFKDMELSLRGRKRNKGQGSFVAWNILSYWFAGLLWLMNDEAGACALQKYSGDRVEKDAYRKARGRLKLNGYRSFANGPPVRGYHPKTKKYEYAPGWTHLEPN